MGVAKKSASKKGASRNRSKGLDLAQASLEPGHNGLVSVITPFLNGEQFFDDAARSVFGQTYSTWEWLLVDDGSSDASCTWARRLAELFPDRAHYLHHKN